MRALYFFIITLSYFSCASAKLRAPINFSQAESIHYGSMTKTDLIKIFGKPDNISIINPQLTLWSYEELYPGIDQKIDRLNISINPSSGVVLGATWTPRPNETISTKTGILEYYKSARFKIKVEGQVSKDYFSRDEIYSDDNLGVSFLLNTVHNTVQYVGLSQPQPNRRLGTQ